MLSRRGRHALTLRMTIAVALTLGVMTALTVPGGIDAARLIAAQDAPEELADLALEKKFNAKVANDEITAALAADDPELAQSFVELADSRRVAVAPALRALVEEANGAAAQTLRASLKFVEGFVIGQPDDFAGLAGTVTGDLFVFGDIRDIVRETSNLTRGDKADELVLGLACAGLAITAGTYASLGTAAPARVGVSLVKAASKTGRMSAKFADHLVRPVRAAVDMPALKAAFGPSALIQPAMAVRSARAAVKTEKMQGIVKTLGELGQVQSKAGTRAALDGLRLAEHPKDVTRLARLATAKGGKTRAVLKVLGRGAIVLAASLWTLTSWMFWAAMLLVGFAAALKRTTERLALFYFRWRRRVRARRAVVPMVETAAATA
jgi:hypothetical protein